MHTDKKLTTVDSVKFLGLTQDNSLSWIKHIEAITHKLSAATFAIRAVQPFLSLDSLKLIYHSYCHSVLTVGIIFCGNTPHSNVIIKMQNRMIRIEMGIRNRDYCTAYIKRLKILLLQSHCLLSLLLFVAGNVDYLKLHSDIHGFNTKNKYNLHLSAFKFDSFPEGTQLFMN